jgi:hypothetical protein
MPKKLELRGSAVLVTDTITNIIEVAHPSKDVWYNEQQLQKGIVQLYDSNGTTGRGMASVEFPKYVVSDLENDSGTAFQINTFREFAVSNFGFDRLGDSASSISQLGWALYRDTQYTSASPLVVAEGQKVNLNNNAGSTITSHLPSTVTALYNGSSKKITPNKLGDTMDLRISFKCFTDIQTGYGEVSVNIGGTIGDILNIPVNFPRGTGSNNERNFVETNLIYSLGTFMANGGEVFYESIRGETSICDIDYTILITSKGK